MRELDCYDTWNKTVEQRHHDCIARPVDEISHIHIACSE